MWARICVFFFQAEDGIRDLVRSRGLGDVYKRQGRQRAAGGAEDAGEPGDSGEAIAVRLPSRAAELALSLIHI